VAGVDRALVVVDDNEYSRVADYSRHDCLSGAVLRCWECLCFTLWSTGRSLCLFRLSPAGVLSNDHGAERLVRPDFLAGAAITIALVLYGFYISLGEQKYSLPRRSMNEVVARVFAP